MKYFYSLIIGLLMYSTQVLAQQPAKHNVPPPLPTREVSGIVKDSTDLGVIGATVSLTSHKDTLKVSTNTDGVFVFKNVKSATYTLVVQSIGYTSTAPMRFKQNDAVPRIIMDPIVLKEKKNTLNEVVINGTPSITYKTDTVEYKASDYIVRKNATVDELLKKMEGMEVANDGTLTHQGQTVTKAKLNGKEYLGGDLANAIKNLPAEIVDKIQVVDDYGDQAARTGIKDGDPEKVLNITTRTDKSVGNMANVNAGAGNDKRYEAGLFGTRINQNQVLGLNARLNNTVNGVAQNNADSGAGAQGGGGRGGQGAGGRGANNGSSTGSGGTTRTGNASFSYRDKLGKKVQLNLNYGYGGTDVHSINSSDAQNFTSLGTIFSTRGSVNNTNSRNHNFRAEIEANLDSNNFLRIIPTLTYTSSSGKRADSLFQTGIIHQDQISANKNKNTSPKFGASVFYQHLFKKPRRNFSIQADLNSNRQHAEQEQDSRILYYLDASETVAKDSLINRIVSRKNLQRNYRGSLTYVEPLSTNTQLEFNGQINYNGYDNTATTSNIDPLGNAKIIDSLSNIYDYSFTQARIALNYRYGLNNTSKVRFSLGLTAVPALLSGTKVSLGTSTSRSSFNIIPIARFEYLFSRQHRLSVNYSGNAVEPTFDQIQPVRDVSNPQNPVVGNPDLKATFSHSINGNYNNYIANSKLNYSLNFNTTFTQNAVVRNNVQIRDAYNSLKTETRFVNMDGVYRFNANYSINKQLNDRKYNLAFSGSVNYNHGISMSNDIRNITRTWTFIERFGPRINPKEWLEVNPNVSYNVTSSDNTLPTSIDSRTNTVALNIDGKVYFWDTWLFGYSASKNYVSGISSNITSNPFVVNMYIEKELFNRRGRVSFQAFDLFNQNNFVNRVINDNSIVDTRSNALSRYFMLRLSMRLQKWSGARGKGGRGIIRRGDGSFMQ
jgi:hypothetical protein